MNKGPLNTLILLLLIVAGAVAQQPAPSPSPPPPQQTSQSQKPEEVDVVRITTNLVQVDAVVTDRNGKVVTDLKPEEVQICGYDSEKPI